MTKGMKWWLNTEIKLLDKSLKKRVVIYAIKHQSAWETVFCTFVFMPSIVLKKALIFLPVIGLYFLRAGAIPITRDQGLNALRKMGRNAKKAVKENRSMMIFLKVQESNQGSLQKKNHICLEFFSYIQKQKFP